MNQQQELAALKARYPFLFNPLSDIHSAEIVERLDRFFSEDGAEYKRIAKIAKKTLTPGATPISGYIAMRDLAQQIDFICWEASFGMELSACEKGQDGGRYYYQKWKSIIAEIIGEIILGKSIQIAPAIALESQNISRLHQSRDEIVHLIKSPLNDSQSSVIKSALIGHMMGGASDEMMGAIDISCTKGTAINSIYSQLQEISKNTCSESFNNRFFSARLVIGGDENRKTSLALEIMLIPLIQEKQGGHA